MKMTRSPSIWLILFILCSPGLSWLLPALKSESSEVYPWKSKSKYYYGSTEDKLQEILNGNCMGAVKTLKDSEIRVPTDSSQLYVSSFPASKDIVDWWKGVQKPKQMRVEPFLCEDVYNKKLPIFNNKGCQLPAYMSPSAPRCQTQYLKKICEQAQMNITDTTANQFVLPESDHATTFSPPVPYLLTARNSFVSLCGQIASPCGFVHTNANCMATGYKVQATQFQSSCSIRLLQQNSTCLDANVCDVSLRNFTEGDSVQCNAKTPFSTSAVYYEKVFVVAEVDDTYVYHIHLEILPRLVYHLDFLLANPDIKIMFGCDSKKGKGGTEAGLRQGLQALTPYMQEMGLSMDRLIVHQHVIARDIYLPMEGGCQDPVYNTWQILTMRQLVMQRHGHLQEENRIRKMEPRADGVHGVKYGENKPVMMLLKRSSGAKHTRNRFDLVRQWSDEFAGHIISNLTAAFPQYNVVLYSDRNETLMQCYACQVAEFVKADVLIGVHGAGLGNMIYMKPNSAVVEFAPYGNDGRCLLGGGPFSRTAAVMSHNYMMHHPPYEEFKWNSHDMTSEFDITRFVIHIRSFLKSIDFL